MRLAWFTPWPPDPSGVAGRSADLVPGLAARGEALDVFVDASRVPAARRAGDGPPAPGDVRVQSAHDFVWRAARHQYDLIVYQVGNSRLHEFIWPYLFASPGLAVLHDARLHHARGRARLSHHDAAGYRAEFRWSHPGAPPGAAELGVAGFSGSYYYQWPMRRAVLEGARLVAVHSPALAAGLRAEYGRDVESIALGGGRVDPVPDAERRDARAALGLDPGAVLFGVFGGLTAEKRLVPILRAFATTHARVPHARLLLAGAPDPSLDVAARAADLGIGPAILLRPDLDDAAFDRAIAAADVTLHLRWPTALETSGPWIRALAAGRATVVSDLAHQAHVSVLDPRTWAPTSGSADAIAVAIDLLDEDHSLRAAMLRLAADAPLRDRLGCAARAAWLAEHHPERVLDDYQRVCARAAQRPSPAPLPGVFRPDPAAHARALVRDFGDLSCALL